MEEKQEKSRIDRQFDFIREIDKEKFITRQTFLSDAKRREKDAEHAWREVKAADRLYGILPEDQGEKLRELWEEFEEAQTPEAKFAHVMDNVQPAMLNDYTEGKDWSAKGVRLSQILERNAHTAEGSQKLWDYAYTNFIEPNVKTGKIKDDTK